MTRTLCPNFLHAVKSVLTLSSHQQDIKNIVPELLSFYWRFVTMYVIHWCKTTEQQLYRNISCMCTLCMFVKSSHSHCFMKADLSFFQFVCRYTNNICENMGMLPQQLRQWIHGRSVSSIWFQDHRWVGLSHQIIKQHNAQRPYNHSSFITDLIVVLKVSVSVFTQWCKTCYKGRSCYC